MKLKQRLAIGLSKLLGWKFEDKFPDIQKCVIAVAPHTSNWDFFYGKLSSLAVGRKTHFLIKSDWFFFPMNYFFKWVGGIPVYRNKKNNSMTDRVAQYFKDKKKLSLGITPEGTRKANPDWKKGFYYIAKKANVPILLSYIDYAKKKASIAEIFVPTDDEAADLQYIKNFFKNITGKVPANFAI
ncbi:MAG: 1-acyl-sn-glycerol-3-phosphate acyltransferase [Bacteroidales bacterium]|nr:1-acyl-sn-glycerol-3-phosphate acyltransferase [Bacteroidales bacterium]